MKLKSIQSLRWFAATLVVVCHAYPPAKLGAIGVDIFFVISGYIITQAMRGKTASAFLVDRLLRIYPIYWICAVPTAILAYSIGAMTWPRTITSITLWPVIGEFLQPYLVVGWTLSFEMLFYLCAAAILVNRRFLAPIALGYILSMMLAFATGSPLFRFIGNPLILEFLFGAAIARLPSSSVSPLLGVSAWIGAGLLLAVSDPTRLFLPQNAFDLTAPERALAWGIPAALMVWGALQLENRVRAWRLMPFLGDASYSIYLTHGVGLVASAFLPWPIQVAAATGLGVVTFRWVESPLLLKLRQRRDQKMRISCDAPASTITS